MSSTARFLDLYAELYKTMPPSMNAVSFAQMMSLFATREEEAGTPSIPAAWSRRWKRPTRRSPTSTASSPRPLRTGQKALSYAFDGFCVSRPKQARRR